MGGARVFPGGAVDPIDSGPLASSVVRWSGHPDEFPWRAAALRELAEEVGIVLADGPVDVSGRTGEDLFEAVQQSGFRLDADALGYLGNWVTPRGLPKRFDARFYAVEVGSDISVRSDRTEVYDPVWIGPAAALARAEAGEWIIEAPTRAHLELLAGFDDIAQVARFAAAATPVKIEPRLTIDAAGAWLVLMPGDPGYDEEGV